jgi:hypothetical protein
VAYTTYAAVCMTQLGAPSLVQGCTAPFSAVLTLAFARFFVEGRDGSALSQLIVDRCDDMSDEVRPHDSVIPFPLSPSFHPMTLPLVAPMTFHPFP